MRLDDLTGYREAQAGILAESLTGTIRIEALENALEGVGGNAGPIVIDDDLESVAWQAWSAAPLAGRSVMRTMPPGFEKDFALSIRLLNT